MNDATQIRCNPEMQGETLAVITAVDDAVLDVIRARVEAGATQHRKVRANEEDALIRAAIGWREIAKEALLEVLEYRKLSEESMEVSADPMRANADPSA